MLPSNAYEVTMLRSRRQSDWGTKTRGRSVRKNSTSPRMTRSFALEEAEASVLGVKTIADMSLQSINPKELTGCC